MAAIDEKYPLALPLGTVLAGQYIIQRVLGQGGFGITYEVMDHKTGGRYALKEYFPDSLATRVDRTTVSPFSGERGESYEYGKACFLQEAETLSLFIGNENIVRIYSYFEEYGTAYFVMDYIEGTSFDSYIRQQGGRVSYYDAFRILLPVMEALDAVHTKGIIHRDVTPDNIYLTKEG
ncbi:MAG: protein kinase, partial [Lachnospiraceae bacterium]|nr:protein kinase [Lachnospiraceae bacterium]